jgi:hypothetical protein
MPYPTNEAEYRAYWAVLLGKSPRDIYVPKHFREERKDV